ncbi:esterase-like activity of phytase family protein [Piscinibacter sp. XHJ-5]|uniref:esterase-like activity of phytase family protein n=1 Tax=Piscinibacter sp. XHJ-5 TaxID=3037797 RepID=UPI002452B1F6|nr:esterase-like activity of phytase family protein [Piscinibacter sp. XHJ-5]
MRLNKTVLAAFVSFGLTFTLQARAVELIAIGKLAGTLRDFSGQSALLENGVPGDQLGGLGSGLAWAGGNVFLALPDRGPNAVSWNAGVDHTTSYVPRFHTLQLDLRPAPDASTGLPYTLVPTLLNSTLLYSHVPLNYGAALAGHAAVPALNTASRHYFSGRSDNFDAATGSGDTRDARLDPEGIRVSRNGRAVYITDEYGPYLYEFDVASGARLRAIPLPANLAIAHKSAVSAEEIAGNARGRVANKGMEGLAISPDGKKLFGFVQSPLIEDGGDGGRANRIVAVDLETGHITQYAYDNYLADKAKAFNSSELLALNDHELLVLERDGKGLGDDSKAAVKRIYKIDLTGAQDVSALSGEASLLAKAVSKTLFLDIVVKLQAAGIAAEQIPAKLEGMAFGEDIVVDGVVKHTLYVANDNDFLPTTPGGKANPNQWFVFSFGDEDLGGSLFVNQRWTRRP